MMRFRWLVLMASLLLSSCLTRSTIVKASGHGRALVPDQEVVYKRASGVDLKLHVFTPEDWKPSDKRPAIVFFFGGAWVGGNPTQFYPHCKYLASRGMVAMSAEYRVSSRHDTTPKECVKDGKSAVRWIRQHGKHLGVDPDRVAAGGGSAGGQVAAAAGSLDRFDEPGENLKVSSRPDAVVLFSSVIDNSRKGYGYDRVQDYWEDFSPAHNVSSKSPPTIVFLGTKDDLIPVSTMEEYQRRMHDSGRRCDVHLYRGKGHGFFNAKKKRSYVKTVKEMDAFLVSLGFLEKGSAE
ncbi:alpha/beta hydrolase [Haloferula sp.]|uniref:alpha/beta hydrolase n=1 Tax=Haloferula sp. TaxID=2497595 RepID=UPI00329BAFD8